MYDLWFPKLKGRGLQPGLGNGNFRPGFPKPGFFRPGEKFDLNPEPGPDLKFSPEIGPEPEFRVRAGFFPGRAKKADPEKL